MKQIIYKLIFTLLFALPLKAQVLQTIAGMNGDGGLAKDACINLLYGMAFDLEGNMYVSDMDAAVIRKISAQTGIITQVVGNGVKGYSGDGGLAINAVINSPTKIVFDNFGNMYFGDLWNFRIRKVNLATGIITTVAGNGINGSGDTSRNNLPAISGSIGYVYYMAVDSIGNLYFSDSYLWKVDVSTGIITKLKNLSVYDLTYDRSNHLFMTINQGKLLNLDLKMGTLEDMSNLFPVGFSVDKLKADNLGNLYFSFTYFKSHQIGKINLKTKEFTIAVGKGEAGYSGDDGLATEGKFRNCQILEVDKIGNVYIGDIDNNNIRKVDVSTGLISTFAGNGCYGGDGKSAALAFLNNPVEAVVDSIGNIFIADRGNNRIRKIDALTGIITTIAGNGVAGYNGDSILAIDASLDRPSDIALDRLGNLYIADYYANRIRKVDLHTGLITTVAGNGISGYSTDGVPAKQAKLNLGNISLDSVGNLIISDNNRIRKIDKQTEIITTIAGNGLRGFSGDGNLASLAKLNGPGAITYDNLGNLYFSDGLNKRIRKVAKGTNIISTIAGTGNASYNGDSLSPLLTNMEPGTIKILANGDMYFNEINRIRKISDSSRMVSIIAGKEELGYSQDGTLAKLANFQGISAIVFDGSGDIILPEYYGNRLRKISYQNEFTIWSSTLLPKREDTVTLYTSYQDSASYFEWNVSPNTFSYIMGTNANSGQPKIRFNKMGLYSIQLKLVYKGDTLTKTRLHYLNVLNPLLQNLDFTANKINPSYLDTLSLDLMFNDTAEHIQWTISPNTFNFVEGTNQTLRQPKLRFSQKGLYTVQVAVAYKGDTLIKTKTNYISVGSPPFPPLSFTSNNQLPKIGDTVTLVPQFLDSIWFYKWTVTPEQHNYLPGSSASSASPQMVLTGIDQYYDVTLQIGYYLDSISTSQKKYFYVSKSNGLAQQAQQAYLVYPNPSSGKITIESNGQQYPILCEVWDATGKLQASQSISHPQTELSLPSAQGLYLLQIKDSEGRVAKMKVIKE